MFRFTKKFSDDLSSHHRGGGVEAPPEKVPKIKFQVPWVFGVVMVLGMLLQQFIMALHFEFAHNIKLGTFISFGGIGLNMWAMSRFRKHKTSSHPKHQAVKLIEDGPYRFTRNPLYLGTGLGILGFGIAFDIVWIVLGSFLALFVIHYVAVLPEERYLLKIFGEEYKSYMRKVRRWL